MTHKTSFSGFSPEATASGPARSPARLVVVLLSAILLLAFGLRTWGIDFGLPYEGITHEQISFEESKEVQRALKLGAGEYAWRFGKGGLYYILFIEYGVLFAVSWLLGWVADPREFAVQILQDRTTVYVMGRVTVALMGTLTCFVLYRICRRLYDWRVALACAFIGATAYYHTVFSAVINVDIGMTLSLWTAFLLYLIYEESGRRWLLYATGAMAAVAVAFKAPGAVAFPMLLLALASSPGIIRTPARLAKSFAIVVASALVTLTAIAPEWTTKAWGIFDNYSGLFESDDADADAGVDLYEDVKALTVLNFGPSTGYVMRLLNDHNIVLTMTAVIGFALGIWRRQRWDILWGVMVILFVLVMSISDRSQPERYLLPIMPALWILSARAVMHARSLHWSLVAPLLVAVVLVSTTGAVRAAYERTQPDTRLIAKDWIEANIEPNARILIDGPRYRLMHGPPINHNEASIARLVGRASQEGPQLARGVSDLMLDIYQEGLLSIDGPKYDLHSTMYGLVFERPELLSATCFDYLVESSYVSRRYAPGSAFETMYPAATQFYRELRSNPQYRLVYEVSPKPWQSSGPRISVYRMDPECLASADDSDGSGA